MGEAVENWVAGERLPEMWGNIRPEASLVIHGGSDIILLQRS